MNADIIEDQWADIKDRLKQQWSRLTDADIAKINGSYDALCHALQKKYGYQKKRSEKAIGDFIKKYGWMEL